MPGATLAGRVRVGDFAVIGSNATVLPDLVIGEGAFVAAGAVVTKNVPPWSLVAGCPARLVRPVVPVTHDGGALQALQAAMGRGRFQ
jgi:acetyltransferase EpsM